jgi:prevent-host-death family protein
MKNLSAVELRKSLGQVARTLDRDGEPVTLTLRGRPVGVLISVRDWNERFTSRAARAERRRRVAEILADRRPADVTIDEALHEVRRG